jgi:hypothetical protein
MVLHLNEPWTAEETKSLSFLVYLRGTEGPVEKEEKCRNYVVLLGAYGMVQPTTLSTHPNDLFADFSRSLDCVR